jgi:hypothetical protein
LLESVRTATGNSVFYRRGAIRRVLRALEANQAVAFLIDQHMQPADSVYVDFFNRPAATTSALAALALRTGAPVVPVFALPLPGGRFRMVYEHAVEPPSGRRTRDHRIHPTLHRRARDVRPEISGSLAMDASPVARCSGGEHVKGCFRRRRPKLAMPPTMWKRERSECAQRLVIRAPNWLGDAVMALPALAAVRAGLPETHITIAAITSVAPLFQEDTSAAPNDVLAIPDRSRETKTVADGTFDAGLLLTNSFRTAWMLRRAGIADRWGFATNARGFLLTRRVARPRARVHQSKYYSTLVEALALV